MCGRFSLATPVSELAELFDADADGIEAGEARYNIAPTDPVVIVRHADAGSGARRTLDRVRWGLIPNWAEDPAALPLMINARSESLGLRPAFRDLIPHRRCVVPADGFYEWRTEAGVKRPYWIRRRDGAPLAFAGLYDRWSGPDGAIDSCTIVTGDANPLLAPLHHRAPVSLDGERLARWLEEGPVDPAALPALLAPVPAETLELVPIGTRVNRVAEDDAGILEPEGDPIREPEDWTRRPAAGSEAPPDQLGLF